MSTSNKKSRRKSLIAVVLAAALLITGAYAFLTATTETKVNNFTVGNIKIDLDEGPWDELPDTDMDGIPDVAEEIVSGQIIEKAPSIKNIGANDAYGFLLVSVPKAQSAVIAAADGTVARDDNMQPIPSTNVELFELLNAEGKNRVLYGALVAQARQHLHKFPGLFGGQLFLYLGYGGRAVAQPRGRSDGHFRIRSMGDKGDLWHSISSLQGIIVFPAGQRWPSAAWRRLYRNGW